MKAYLVEHILQVRFGVHPRRNCITKEDEILHNPSRVDANHQTHATERRILLLIVTNVAQRCAPKGNRCAWVKTTVDNTSRRQMSCWFFFFFCGGVQVKCGKGQDITQQPGLDKLESKTVSKQSPRSLRKCTDKPLGLNDDQSQFLLKSGNSNLDATKVVGAKRKASINKG